MLEVLPGGELDPEEMTLPELEHLLVQVRAELKELDACEPEDESSEEYETWGDEHEDLEDLADELLDLIDEKKG